MTERLVECTRRVAIFAASCSGCQDLAQAIGLPVSCLRAAVDVEAAIEAMNRTGYASAVLWPEGFQPFKLEDGWRDWRAVALGPEGRLPSGLHFKDGHFAVDLPARVAVTTFETALHAEFARFAVAEVTATPRWLIAQCDAGRPFRILPRYTLASPSDFRADTRRVDDLFVIHPRLHMPPIARALLRARHVAEQLADEVTRHV